MNKNRILIVCMWPLGGIRTYLKYNYRYFPTDEFEITLLANRSIEADTLESDMAAEGVRVIWSESRGRINRLYSRVAQELRLNKYDLIHSQGFISALHVGLVNRRRRLPHIFTIHGVLEKKRFAGLFGGLKKWFLEKLLTNVSVVHGVGDDILAQIRESLPSLDNGQRRWISIKNGIDPSAFIQSEPDAPRNLRHELKLDDEAIVCGYFGRFMPEKGFDYLIGAFRILNETNKLPEKLAVLAVGSGDFEERYKYRVNKNGLEKIFYFRPFRAQVASLMKGCDLILMPSIWEAYPLLSSEVLCCGIPLIATDCVGLREAVAETPAVSVKAGNAQALADGIDRVLQNDNIKEVFQSYRQEAAIRFNVKQAATKLVELIREEIKSGRDS